MNAFYGIKIFDHVQKLSHFEVFGHFLGNRSLKVSYFLHDGRGHPLSAVQYMGKILIWRLRGIKCQKFWFLDIFSETVH